MSTPVIKPKGKPYIKNGDGRIVAAVASQIKIVDGVRVVDESKLKPGWSVATEADITKQKAANDAADKKRDAAQKVG